MNVRYIAFPNSSEIALQIHYTTMGTTMFKIITTRLVHSCIQIATGVLLVMASSTSWAQDAGEIDMRMANLASQLSSRINGSAGWRIAVVPFATGGGLSSEMSEYMVRSLSTQLINGSSVDIVERQLLSSAMNEMKLQQSGAFDRQSMVELGRLLGANAVITGSATSFQDVVSIHAVVLDVQKGLNIGAGSVHLRRDQRSASSFGSVTPDRQIHDPMLSGPRVQQFRTHRVEVARVQNFGNGRVGVWLRYTPTTGLSYAVSQGANECTAQLTTAQGNTLRCVRSSLPPLSVMPNGMPLSAGATIAHYEFEGNVGSAARFHLTAVNGVAPVLLTSPLRNIERVTVSFTDLVSS